MFFSFFYFKITKSQKSEKVIKVYNWGAGMSDGSGGTININEIFTKETGIKIEYTTFQSNEEMYAKIAANAADYDVIIPSDYMIAKLIKNDLIKKINFDNIPNYKFIDSRHKYLNFDPKNEYSVPYMWGVIGIFYNLKYIKEEEITWDVLWNESYKDKILYFDNIRDAFGISLLKLHRSVNSHNPKDWYDAYEELRKQRHLIQSYMSDQIFDKLNTEEAYIAPFYCSVDTSGLITNSNIKFAVPKEGTNKFIDAACIPKNSIHQEEAEKYINFLCRKDISFENIKTIGYLSPQTEVNEELMKSPIYKLASTTEKTETYTDLDDDILKLADELWVKIKVIKNSTMLEKFLLIIFTIFLIFSRSITNLTYNSFLFLKSKFLKKDNRLLS